MKTTHLPGGSLYPILLRFERGGVLTSDWETDDPSALGRPRRRLYHLTPNGRAFARGALEGLAPAFRLRSAEG